MSANQDSGISNVHSYFGKKYTIQENLVPICDLKGYVLTNKCFTCIVYSQVFMISFEFHIRNGNLQLTSYSLQEISTIFREMSANQVHAVHSFSDTLSPSNQQLCDKKIYTSKVFNYSKTLSNNFFINKKYHQSFQFIFILLNVGFTIFEG